METNRYKLEEMLEINKRAEQAEKTKNATTAKPKKKPQPKQAEAPSLTVSEVLNHPSFREQVNKVRQQMYKDFNTRKPAPEGMRYVRTGLDRLIEMVWIFDNDVFEAQCYDAVVETLYRISTQPAEIRKWLEIIGQRAIQATAKLIIDERTQVATPKKPTTKKATPKKKTDETIH